MSEEQAEKYQERMKEYYGVTEFSKNERAGGLCGVRPHGQPLFSPHELGFVCPICGGSGEGNLEFSEYKMFLWCKRCNLDIPSCLCVCYPEPRFSGTRKLLVSDRIAKATKLFLDCIEETFKKGGEKDE